jgi:hypothetical protein
MKCQNCGGYIKRRDTYCPHCGDKLHIPISGSQQKTRDQENSSDDKTEEFNDSSPVNAGKSGYKPLQERYLRGEYQNNEDEFYNQYIEDQYIDERHHYNEPKKNKNQDAHYNRTKKRNYHDEGSYQGSRKRNFQDDNKYYQKPQKKYRGYDLSAYYPDEEEKSSGSGMLPVILILLIALLIGFIIGIMMFTNSTLPSFG